MPVRLHVDIGRGGEVNRGWARISRRLGGVTMVGLIHEELSQTIIGAAMQVPWKRIVQSMPEWR